MVVTIVAAPSLPPVTEVAEPLDPLDAPWAVNEVVTHSLLPIDEINDPELAEPGCLFEIFAFAEDLPVAAGCAESLDALPEVAIDARAPLLLSLTKVAEPLDAPGVVTDIAAPSLLPMTDACDPRFVRSKCVFDIFAFTEEIPMTLGCAESLDAPPEVATDAGAPSLLILTKYADSFDTPDIVTNVTAPSLLPMTGACGPEFVRSGCSFEIFAFAEDLPVVVGCAELLDAPPAVATNATALLLLSLSKVAEAFDAPGVVTDVAALSLLPMTGACGTGFVESGCFLDIFAFIEDLPVAVGCAESPDAPPGVAIGVAAPALVLVTAVGGSRFAESRCLLDISGFEEDLPMTIGCAEALGVFGVVKDAAAPSMLLFAEAIAPSFFEYVAATSSDGLQALFGDRRTVTGRSGVCRTKTFLFLGLIL